MRHFFKALSFCVYFLLLAVFIGCAPKSKIENASLDLPQDSSYFLSGNDLVLPKNITETLKENYLKIWYWPWTDPSPNLNVEEVFWMAPSLLKLKGYGPNLKPYSYKELQEIYDSLDIVNYPSAEIKAIVTRDAMVRAVPTLKPYFKTRENYPFDRWQNSLIFAGTPVLITHFNPTKEWAHIQSSFVYGWVRVEDLAKITPEDEKLLLGIKQYVMPNHDRIGIYNDAGEFMYLARMGEIFAIRGVKGSEANAEFYPIYLPYRKANGMLELIRAKVKRDDFSLFPRRLSPIAMASVVDSMLGDFYGWGGALESRDCSAFIRDSFANFGIFLPRNSAAQAKYANNMIDLSRMKAEEKEAYIIKNATPFATILWLKGHIMLYIGSMDGRAIVAHSAWSVTTRSLRYKTENLLGGAVITTLVPENQKNGRIKKAKTLLDRILGMSDLYDYILKLDSKKVGQ